MDNVYLENNANTAACWKKVKDVLSNRPGFRFLILTFFPSFPSYPQKMPKVPKPTCCVCFDPFNKTTKHPTTCPHCAIQICRGCFQTYLLNDISDVPRCVNVDCSRGWERNFLDEEFTTTFRLKTYKEHREKVLADKEKAKLPATQEDAAAMRGAKDMMDGAMTTLAEKTAEYRRLLAEVDEAHRHVANINRVMESHGRVRMPIPGETAAQAKDKKKETAAFIKPCPAEGCKGFLSTAWKCGLCDLYTCPDCHDLKGPVRDTPGHTCDPTKVETARLIAKEAKSCPKCGVSICKIEGCDLMWCTQCNTGFNWRTGKIADGPIHNPHYFEWLRTQGREAAPGAAPPRGCGEEQDREIMTQLYGGSTDYHMRYATYHTNHKKQPEVQRYIAEAWRLMREAEDNARVENEDGEEKLRVLRVRYMLGTLTEEDWRTALQRSEKDLRFRVAKAQIAQVFAGGAREIILQILAKDHNKTNVRLQLEDLVKYCNTCYDQTAKQFGRKLKPIVVLEPPKPSPRGEPEALNEILEPFT